MLWFYLSQHDDVLIVQVQQEVQKWWVLCVWTVWACPRPPAIFFPVGAAAQSATGVADEECKLMGVVW